MSSSSGTSETSSSAPERRHSEGRHRDSRVHSPFVPILILALALLTWSTFQTVMLMVESNGLAATRENQEVQKKNAEKIRQALDGVARDTARLADKGNTGARLIVEELRKRGVTINPNAPPPEKK